MSFDTQAEVWKEAVGFPDYNVSNHGGRVMRITSGMGARTGRLLKFKSHNRGYLLINLRRDGKSYTLLVHRLVAATFLGPCPDGHQVNHKDSDRTNPSLTNLEYVTATGNIEHSYLNGRRATGQYHHLSRLTQPQVNMMLTMRRVEKLTYRVLAVLFGVSQSTVHRTVTGQSWKHGSNTGISSCAV